METGQLTYSSDSSDYMFSDATGTTYRNLHYYKVSEDTSRYYDGDINVFLVYDKSTHIGKNIIFSYYDQITGCGNTYFFSIENVLLTETATELQGQLTGKNIAGHNFELKTSTCMQDGSSQSWRDYYRDTAITNTSLISFSLTKKDIVQSNVFSNPATLSLEISPNPTTGLISVRNAPENILHVTVSTILGETVLELAHPNAPDFTLDLSKLPAGIYVWRIYTSKSSILRTMVKE